MTKVLALVLVLTGCGATTPADSASQVPQPPANLSELVGWYRMPAGDTALLTYSARGGLRLFALRDTFHASTFVPAEDGRLHEGTAQGPVVEFTRRSGSVTGFRWPVGSGEEYAERLRGHGYRIEPFPVDVDGVTLAGTLFLPRDRPGPVPGAVIIHGSGASDRDNGWYMIFADTLVRTGLAVLLPDKRGSGQSGGDWFTTGLAGFADDVAAQVEALRRHPAVDADRVGLVGMSQGGHIAPMAAGRVDPAFIVNVSGSAVPLEQQLVHELRQDMKRDRLPGILDPLVLPISIRVVKRRRPEWWQVNGPIDPIEHWANVTAPVITLYGRLDELDNVPVARSVERLDSLGLPNMDVWVFEGVGHGLTVPDPYRVRSDILERLAAWVAEVVSLDDDGGPQASAADSRLGWYMTPSGDPVLVSPAPGHGYRRLDFANASFGSLKIGEGPDGFRWVDAGSGGPALQSVEGERWSPWPAAPYHVREVSFQATDGEHLEGVLLQPRQPSGRGAVILHGSGSSDRDNVWAYTFAHALAEDGLAVLFPDKRGSGASTGDWRTAGFDALARDAASAARKLALESGLPLDSIGWVGLSQGGWIAPLAARIAGHGAFLVSVSSAAVPVFDQIAFEVEHTLRGEGFPEAAVASALELQAVVRRHALGQASWREYREARQRALAGAAAPFAEAMPAEADDWRWAWWAAVGDYDPVGSWARAGLPTLVLYGGQDESDNIPVTRSVERLRHLSLRPKLGRNVTFHVFPDLGHALVDPESGWVSRSALERMVAFARSGGSP